MSEQFNNEEVTVTLTLDDDTELECAVLTIYEVDGQEYIALLPMDDAENEDGDVYLYRYAEVDGEPTLDNIEDDEDGLNELLNYVIAGRVMAANANFYAFTATPKNKTLEIFGVPYKAEQPAQRKQSDLPELAERGHCTGCAACL